MSGVDWDTFWSKVDKRGPDECWPWLGTRVGSGYGRFKVGGKMFVASRLSLQDALGRELCAAEQACHRCDNPPCVNPAHLFAGGARENSHDAHAKGRLHKWNGARTGELNPKAKLTREQALAVRNRTAPGSIREIARRLGVSKETIKDIRKHRTWSNLS